MKPHSPILAVLATLAPVAFAGEFTVEQKPFKATVSLEGTFLPETVHTFELDPKLWADFTIEDLVLQGGPVKQGEPVVILDTEAIDRKLADDEDSTRLRKLTLAAAERDLKNLETTTPWKLEAAELAYQRAKDDEEYFKAISRPLQEESARRSLESAERSLESATEELNQLLKMYKEDDLTEETEEIILKRQRYQVEASEFRLKTAKEQTKRTLEVAIPRQSIDQEQAMRDAELIWNTQRKTMPQSLEEKRLELKKARIEDKRADETSADLKADRAQMDIKAPATGRVYHGEITEGRWNPANAAKFMKVGGKIPPKMIFASLVPDDANLVVYAFVDEAVVTRLAAGQSGYVAPKAAPRSRLPVSVTEVSNYPAVDGKFQVVLKVEGKPEGFQLVPGMSGKAQLTTGPVAGDSLAIPTNALHEEPDGSFTVKVKRDGDKTEQVPVTLGEESNGSIRVLSGLEAGQVIITPEAKPADPKPAEAK